MKQLQDLMLMIGRKRFMTLVITLAVAGGLGFLWQQIMLPKYDQVAREKSTIESDVTRLQREMTELPVKYKALQDNEERYEALVKSSFVSAQDRISARARIDQIRMEAGLRGINYTISPQENVTHPEGANLDGTLVLSKIDVDLKGISDLEMRDFIAKMHDNFGGLVLVKSMEFKVDKLLNHENLKRLQSREPVDFVVGKAKFEWYTVVPPEITEKPDDQQGAM